MADVVIHPSVKVIKVGYVLAALAAIAIGVAVFATTATPFGFIAIFLLVWPLSKHVQRQLEKVTISGDKLRYEVGLLSKTARTIQLSKVQDVTVRQTLKQRLIGIGSLSIETAGETSRLTIANIDEPQRIADTIMEMAQISPKAKGV